jgi:outer membrane protein OmpA-like peptidoglycan-associated protein
MTALQTGEDGVETVRLVPGRWVVAARAEGIGATVQELDVPAGEGALAMELSLGAAQVQVVGTRIDLGAPIRFAFAAAAIEPTSDALLREVAAQLLLHPEFGHVKLRGHTDDVGDPAANLVLARRRADAVRDRLVTLGLDASRLSADGFGDAQPVADNATEAGRAQNRRVEFVVED